MNQMTVQEERKVALKQVRTQMDAMAPEFKAALPAHVDVEKFSRVAMTAIQGNPDLLNADRRSLYGACVKLAQDGLLPDGREAALVIFKNQVQAMPMIAGQLKMVRNSGEVAKVNAQVVYENDHFVVSYGFDENLEHSPPSLGKPRGEPLGAYATAILKDGSKLLEVMDVEQIEKVRKVSRAATNGPWVAWWDQMARKTVLRRLIKRLPVSTDIEEAFERDETMRASRDALQTLDATPEAPAEHIDRLTAIENDIDGETGEIIDAEAKEESGEDPRIARTTFMISEIEGMKDDKAIAAWERETELERGALPDDLNDQVEAALAKKREMLAEPA